MSIDRESVCMILAGLPGMGPVLFGKLEARLEGKVERLLEGGEEVEALCHRGLREQLEHWRRYMPLERVGAALGEMGADYVSRWAQGYPEELAPYADRPIGLYRYRAGKELEGPCLAIVGTRRPSGYGRKMARRFAGELVGHGWTVVSGMAEGVDTEAHEGALAAGGKTAAVLGGGLKRCYPRSNRGLMERIAKSAGVWTEFPPWRQADRRTFPQRNRIVSGVSRGVLVVESGAQGGSLITARMAAEQGKPVYVLPGRVDMPESAGCHALIRDGAQLVTSVAEVLEDLNALPRELARPTGAGTAAAVPASAEPELEGLQSQLWRVLRDGQPQHPDRLAQVSEGTGPEIQLALLEMEMAGHVARGLDGRYVRS